MRTWAIEVPAEPAVTIALKPPTEREALADQSAAEAWVHQWRCASLPPGAVLEWAERAWVRLGRQSVPTRLQLRDPDTVAGFGGGQPARAWSVLRGRVDVLRARWGDEGIDSLVRRHAESLLTWPDARFDQVVAVTQWLAEHPARGLRPRQVPIRGVDTKWLAAHRGFVTDLHHVVTGEPDLGLLDADRLVRLRILDHRLAAALPRDLAAPASQLRDLAVTPRAVFVFENLESVLAMPEWAGCIVVHGSGYAVDAVGALPWVAASPVVYWGDLDSHGFAILHRLRTHLPDVTSVLMDSETLMDHTDLWVSEQKPTRAVLPMLTGSEQTALARLRHEGDVRLEQERIPWDTALRGLARAVSP